MIEKNLIFRQKEFASKSSFGEIEFGFDNNYETILEKGQIFFAKCPRMKKVDFFLKRIFAQNVPRDTKKAVSATLPRTLGKEANKVSLNVRKR